ncbi:MAG: circadian clock protein KaiA [Cyanobacteria bacterium P01_D01_bin.44]
MTARLLVGIFTFADSVAESLRQSLSHSAFVVSWNQSEAEFMEWVVGNRHRIDCLVVQSNGQDQILRGLSEHDIFLPMLVIETEAIAQSERSDNLPYHNAVIHIHPDQLESLEAVVQDAIDRFLKLPSDEKIQSTPKTSVEDEDDRHLFLLSLQQQRLAEKLQERLGYLGVYYKRNPQNFLRNMTVEERTEFIEQLKNDYRRIILNYFASKDSLNQQIDDFVNVAFFADVSVSKIVETHMELMDEFSRQLDLEGRSGEILLDYRLTLIDVVAHLCEMYRRSIPREM